MTVALSELKTWSDDIFACLERSGFGSLDRTDGWYWCIDSDAAWKMDRQPSDLEFGDLADDIADIRKDIIEAKTDPDFAAGNVWHTLDHFIGVLMAVSNQVKRESGITDSLEGHDV